MATTTLGVNGLKGKSWWNHCFSLKPGDFIFGFLQIFHSTKSGRVTTILGVKVGAIRECPKRRKHDQTRHYGVIIGSEVLTEGGTHWHKHNGPTNMSTFFKASSNNHLSIKSIQNPNMPQYANKKFKASYKIHIKWKGRLGRIWMGQFEMPNSPSASCRPDDVILKGWFLMGWEWPNGMKHTLILYQTNISISSKTDWVYMV